MPDQDWQAPFRDLVATFVSTNEPALAQPVTAEAVHLLVPAMRWDWEVEPTGATAAAQLAFCDTMPATCAAGSRYAASSGSFASAYTSFLQLLVGFTPAPMLSAALAATATPADPPASSSSPPGWTKTTDGAGIVRWAHDWLVGSSPWQWMQENGTRSAQADDLDLDAPASAAVGNRTMPLGDAMAVAGTGWTRVPVYPGAWYSAAMVALARDGPFAGGRPPAAVVGPDGLLRCRVSSLIVAADVEVTVDLPRAAAGAVARASEVQVGPLRADDAPDRPTAAVSGASLTLTTPAASPYIVAATYAQP
jgi:hypothetical protein